MVAFLVAETIVPPPRGTFASSAIRAEGERGRNRETEIHIKALSMTASVKGCQMAKFDPFLSLDCARVEGVGAQFCSVA